VLDEAGNFLGIFQLNKKGHLIVPIKVFS